MHAVMLADVVDELGESEHETHEVELALFREQRGARAGGIDPALSRRTQDARNTRVRVLHVVDGILVRLLHRELEIEIQLAVGARLKEEVPRRVPAYGFDHLLEQQKLPGPLAHALEHALV